MDNRHFNGDCPAPVRRHPNFAGLDFSTEEVNALLHVVEEVLMRGGYHQPGVVANGTRYVVLDIAGRDKLYESAVVKVGDEVFVINEMRSYVLNPNKEWELQESPIKLEEVEDLEHDEGASLLADRAIADENGRRIIDEYITYRAAKGYLTQVYNQLFTENPPHIMYGYITTDMLSDGVKDLLGSMGNVVNLPDEEDLTKRNGVLKLADKRWNPNQASGMGRKMLRRNMVNGVNVLTQDMMSEENTIYIIQYDFDLQGAEITIPEDCVLDFQGGSLNNGTIIGADTIIKAGIDKIFENIKNKGGFVCNAVYPQWFGAIANGIEDCSVFIQNAIDFAVNGNIVSNPWDITQIEGHSLKVIIPAGSYLVDNPIYLTSYTNIEGEGRGVTKIVNNAIESGEAIFNCGTYDKSTGNKTTINNSSIRNLSINGRDKRCIGIFSCAHYTTFENLFIQSCGLYGIYGWEMWSSYIHKCHFIYNSINEEGYTIYLDGKATGYGANAANITDCEFIGYDKQLVTGSELFELKCNCFYLNNGHGIKITNASFQQFNIVFTINPYGQSITVENCYFEKNNDLFTGILYGVNIVNNFITVPLASQCLIHSNHVRGCNIINNLIGNNSISLVKPITDNADNYLYQDNRIAGNFCSGHSANVDSSIISYFDTRSNYVLTTTGQMYGTAKGVDTHSSLNITDVIYMPIIDIIRTKISTYNILTFTVKKSNGVTDAPIDEWLLVTVTKCGASAYIVECRPMIPNTRSSNGIWSSIYRNDALSPWEYINSLQKGTTEERPYLANFKLGTCFYDTTLNKPLWWMGTGWIDSTGNDAVLSKGTTAQRPTGVNAGFQYYDTDLNKPIWWTGTAWVDATGAEV